MWTEVGKETVNRLINISINLKNPNIQLITYFPSQLWNKRKDISDFMKELDSDTIAIGQFGQLKVFFPKPAF